MNGRAPNKDLIAPLTEIMPFSELRTCELCADNVRDKASSFT